MLQSLASGCRARTAHYYMLDLLHCTCRRRCCSVCNLFCFIGNNMFAVTQTHRQRRQHAIWLLCVQ